MEFNTRSGNFHGTNSLVTEIRTIPDSSSLTPSAIRHSAVKPDLASDNLRLILDEIRAIQNIAVLIEVAVRRGLK